MEYSLPTAMELYNKTRNFLVSSLFQFVAQHTGYGKTMIELNGIYNTEVCKHNAACTLSPERFTKLSIVDNSILCAFDDAGRAYLISANEDRTKMKSYVSMDTLVSISNELTYNDVKIVEWWNGDYKNQRPEFCNVINQ